MHFYALFLTSEDLIVIQHEPNTQKTCLYETDVLYLHSVIKFSGSYVIWTVNYCNNYISI